MAMSESQKAYLKKYRRKNRERRRLALQEWRAKNREHSAAWQRENRKQNPNVQASTNASRNRARAQDPERFKAYAKKDYRKHRVRRDADALAWKRANPERVRASVSRSIIRSYGITIEQYDALLESQRGLCAICEKPETAKNPRTGTPCRLSIDHDAVTGEVCGLCCRRCNAAIGHLQHDPDRIEAAARYVRRTRKQQEVA